MNLQQDINELNRSRRHIIAGFAIAALLGLSFISLFIYKFLGDPAPVDSATDVFSQFARTHLLMIVACFGLMISLIYAGLSYAKFKTIYKEIFVRKPLADNFDNLRYEWANGFSMDTIKSIFPYTTPPKNYNCSEDLIKASYNGVPFEMSDVMVYFSASGNNKYFLGRMMIIDLPDKLTNSVQIFSKTFTKNYNIPFMSDIEMDSVEFNREYLIKAANPHDAFYLLTPHMMEHIQKLSKRFEGIAIHAFGNKIAFALRNGNTNSFDPKKWYKKISYQEEIYNIYNEIEDIKSIISTICSLGSNPDNSQDNLMPGSFRITYRH